MNGSEVVNLITHPEIKLNLKRSQRKLNPSAFTNIYMQLFYAECRQVALTLQFPVINRHGALTEVRVILFSGFITI